MAQCLYCKTETIMYYSGVPICIPCWNAREAKPSRTGPEIESALVSGIAEADARVSAANDEFNALMNQLPSGLPHPDGAQQIQNASLELSSAREEMMKAHKRLDDFLDRGVVPKDL